MCGGVVHMYGCGVQGPIGIAWSCMVRGFPRPLLGRYDDRYLHCCWISGRTHSLQGSHARPWKTILPFVSSLGTFWHSRNSDVPPTCRTDTAETRVQRRLWGGVCPRPVGGRWYLQGERLRIDAQGSGPAGSIGVHVRAAEPARESIKNEEEVSFHNILIRRRKSCSS